MKYLNATRYQFSFSFSLSFSISISYYPGACPGPRQGPGQGPRTSTESTGQLGATLFLIYATNYSRDRVRQRGKEDAECVCVREREIDRGGDWVGCFCRVRRANYAIKSVWDGGVAQWQWLDISFIHSTLWLVCRLARLTVNVTFIFQFSQLFFTSFCCCGCSSSCSCCCYSCCCRCCSIVLRISSCFYLFFFVNGLFSQSHCLPVRHKPANCCFKENL